jgi:hypothetical protein
LENSYPAILFDGDEEGSGVEESSPRWENYTRVDVTYNMRKILGKFLLPEMSAVASEK